VAVAPELKVVVETDADIARSIGRPFIANPYLKLQNYANNLRRYGYTDDDIIHGGTDRLIDALGLHGTIDAIATGLRAHLDAGADHVAIQGFRRATSGCRPVGPSASLAQRAR
jgi:hypothetical protein